MRGRYHSQDSWALACAVGCLSVVAGVVTAEGSTSEYAGLEALVGGAGVGVALAVGIRAWRRPSVERFGVRLVVAGLLIFVATLAQAQEPLLHSIGRVAGWCAEAWIIYLVLAFPDGWLRGRGDRALVVAAVPVLVAGSAPALVAGVAMPLHDLLAAALFAATALCVARRMRAGSGLARRAQNPFHGVACAVLLVSAAALLSRAVWPRSGLAETSAWLAAVAVPALAVAFLIGEARWRLFIAGATQRLTACLRNRPGPEDLRLALREAFDDPALEITYRTGDGTHLISPPPPGSGRCLTEVRDAGGSVAAIVHDVALGKDSAFIESAGTYAVMALEYHRLSAEAGDLLRAVGESRARIQKSADDERQRIERDLHDGAQQRLVGLRIKLELAAEQLGGDPSAALLRRLATDVDTALDELRSLAHGVYPPPLAHLGLVEALRSAALQSTLPTTVLAAGVGSDYPRQIASTVYFCCAEALQNVAKHARGATAAVIELADTGGRVRFDVRDDGCGFDVLQAAGSGLTGMRDRLAAVGGDLTVVSSPGNGTRVVGTIPVAGAGDPLPRAVRNSAGRRR